MIQKIESDSQFVNRRIFLAGASGAIGRQLVPLLIADGWQVVLDEARAELRSKLVDGAVRFVGHTWLVTATNR